MMTTSINAKIEDKININVQIFWVVVLVTMVMISSCPIVLVNTTQILTTDKLDVNSFEKMCL